MRCSTNRIHLKLECFESYFEKHLRNRGRDHPTGSRDGVMSRSLAAMAGLSLFWYCAISPPDSERGVRRSRSKSQTRPWRRETKGKRGNRFISELIFWTVHREDETGRKRKRASSSLPRSSRLCDAQSSGFAILFPIEVRKWYFSSKDIKQRSTK